MDQASGYREIDHTADIGIEVWAPDWEGLLMTAAGALTDIMVLYPDNVLDYMSENIMVRSRGPREQLHGFLSELVFRFENGMVFKSFEIVSMEDDALAVQARGENLDPDRHGVNNEIKAVTWHRYDVLETGQGLKATIIFDV